MPCSRSTSALRKSTSCRCEVPVFGVPTWISTRRRAVAPVPGCTSAPATPVTPDPSDRPGASAPPGRVRRPRAARARGPRRSPGRRAGSDRSTGRPARRNRPLIRRARRSTHSRCSALHLRQRRRRGEHVGRQPGQQPLAQQQGAARRDDHHAQHRGDPAGELGGLGARAAAAARDGVRRPVPAAATTPGCPPAAGARARRRGAAPRCAAPWAGRPGAAPGRAGARSPARTPSCPRRGRSSCAVQASASIRPRSDPSTTISPPGRGGWPRGDQAAAQRVGQQRVADHPVAAPPGARQPVGTAVHRAELDQVLGQQVGRDPEQLLLAQRAGVDGAGAEPGVVGGADQLEVGLAAARGAGLQHPAGQAGRDRGGLRVEPAQELELLGAGDHPADRLGLTRPLRPGGGAAVEQVADPAPGPAAACGRGGRRGHRERLTCRGSAGPGCAPDRRRPGCPPGRRPRGSSRSGRPSPPRAAAGRGPCRG